MFSISFDESNKPVVRATIRLLQELIGESGHINIGDTITGNVFPENTIIVATSAGSAFTAEELAQAEELKTYGNDLDKPNPAEVFGSGAGKPAPSIVAADPSTIVPAGTPAHISMPTPTSVPLPHAANIAPPAAHVVHHTASHASGVALDSAGLPWDGRIHSREKTVIKDGTWKYKRGVDDATIAQVEAALRALMAIPAGTPHVSAPAPLDPAGTASAPQPIVPAAVPTPAITAPIANPSEVPAGLPPVPALITKITEAQAAGRLATDELTNILTAHGLQVLPDVFKRPDLAPQISASLDALLASKG